MSNLDDPRVLLALERTALAWNRSGLALIAFGFVIEKSNLLVQLVDPDTYAQKIAYSQWLGIAVIVFTCWSIWPQSYNIDGDWHPYDRRSLSMVIIPSILYGCTKRINSHNTARTVFASGSRPWDHSDDRKSVYPHVGC